MSSFNKFKDKNDIHVNRKFYELGTNQELLIHAKWQFHRYLERVFNNPYETNPLESLDDPELRKVLKAEGLVGLTQEEIVKKANDYFEHLAKGGEPYSDKFHPPAEWSESKRNGPVSVLINRETGDWMQSPSASTLVDTPAQQ